MSTLLYFLLSVPAILIATTIHEFTRAAVSTALGDTVPREKGHLTLNPLKHFEPIGFILMMVNGFGWGKPCPTSSLYYKDRKKGTVLTAVLPNVANLVFAGVFMVLYGRVVNPYLNLFCMLTMHYNVCLLVYNIVPVTPMDCLKVLTVALPSETYFKYLQYEKVVQMVFLLLLFMGLADTLFLPLIGGVQMGLYALLV